MSDPDNSRYESAVAVLALVAILGIAASHPDVADAVGRLRHGEWRAAAKPIIYFVVIVAAIFLLERLFPAEPTRSVGTPSLAHDFLWYLFSMAGYATVYTWTTVGLASLYVHKLQGPTLAAPSHWPGWAQTIAAILVVDLVGYVTHRLYHRFQWTWSLHSVHHSQTSLNLFTDSRFHAVEVVLSQFALALPLPLLGLSTSITYRVAWLMVWQTRFQHANIRTGLGPLRYLLVTPQSHRIHHSTDPRHHNLNFGIYLSIWDFLFRTQYKGWDEYPSTGIEDPRFPLESQPVHAVRSLYRQLVYPFTG